VSENKRGGKRGDHNFDVEIFIKRVRRQAQHWGLLENQKKRDYKKLGKRYLREEAGELLQDGAQLVNGNQEDWPRQNFVDRNLWGNLFVKRG